MSWQSYSLRLMLIIKHGYTSVFNPLPFIAIYNMNYYMFYSMAMSINVASLFCLRCNSSTLISLIMIHTLDNLQYHSELDIFLVQNKSWTCKAEFIESKTFENEPKYIDLSQQLQSNTPYCFSDHVNGID